MPNERKQTAFRLSPESLEYLKKYQSEHGLKSLTAAVELIINNDRKKEKNQSENLAKDIVNILEDKYKNTFTRIRLASRTADINSQIILEILNSMLYAPGMASTNFVSTDTLKNEIVEQAENQTKAKIAYYKQLKDNKKTERKNNKW